jgi:hypothetical protein
METSVEDFGLGARFAAMPRTAFLLGTEVEFPAAIEAAAAWADTKVRLPNMDVVTCLNAYDQKLHFTPSEWRWFRSRYDLELKDSNANRRRYGRYGPPGQPSPDVPAPPAADVTAPGTVIPPVQPPMTIRDVPLADVPAPAHKPAVEPPQPRPATGPVLTPLSPPIK